MYRFLLFVCLGLRCQIEAFNISPNPTQRFLYPDSGKIEDGRSSYFGYSLVIREKSVIVAAPRANSTWPDQSKIIEPGMVFRCLFEHGSCSPYDIDNKGNHFEKASTDVLRAKGKDHQWLGGSMDGGTLDSDKLLVCAPRFHSANEVARNGWKYDPVSHTSANFSMIGVCYWLKDTAAEEDLDVTDICPFALIKKQTGNDSTPFYLMGQLGLSGHVTKSSTLIMGAPGIDMFRGSVYLNPENQETGGSRLVRDTRRALHRSRRDVSLPRNWDQEEGSYFGFAVSSGYFDSSNLTNLLYVATAPHANTKSGEAYIFEYRDGGRNIQKHKTFRGEQFGEFFGYSVLVEDLNGDGKSDLIISAPLYVPKYENSHDKGAIYVFINTGYYSFEKTIIHSPVGSKGRFGTTLSQIGDINHDGYNDVAVGAPFAGNGSVLIYLGSKDGLRDQPSQRLDAPPQAKEKYGAHMFGHGLSRGSDIDGNGFNDFVVGAPNADVVYGYKAYPVVKIVARIEPTVHRIQPEQERLNITACFRLKTTSKVHAIQQQELNISIELDVAKEPMDKRAVFEGDTKIRFLAVAMLEEKCRNFEIQMVRKAKFENITMKMNYELQRKIPNTEKFCMDCAIVDPADPKFSTGNITFNTGCPTVDCVADLKLRDMDVRSEFILGTSDVLRVRYNITNEGENAYQPQFNVTSIPILDFAQIPGYCSKYNDVLMCDLNQGFRIAKFQSTYVDVIFDVTQLGGQSLTICANVFSALNESSPGDNNFTTVITLKEHTEIDAIGIQTNDQIVLKKDLYTAELINHYEFKSHGPSTIEKLNLSLYIPIAYKTSDSDIYPIMDLSSFKIQSSYNDSKQLTIELFDPNSVLLKNFTEEHQQTTLSTIRKRREVKGLKVKSDSERPEQKANISQVQTNELLLEENLPKDNTLVLNCQETNRTICVRVELGLDFKPDKSVSLDISFDVDLNEVECSWEYFVIKTDLRLLKRGDPSCSSFRINKKIKSNVICKHAEVSIWKIVLSGIGGVVLLSAITYTLYKNGFFKRTMKYKMSRLIRESFAEVDAAAAENARADGDVDSESD
ncbi:integrin alpha-PS4-like [Drosophila biarmipes]|uniref:integrin alpha-PS4-like n=1 Tax=Drosophila biarmipes TaxID=125945 RepID=UPI0007E653A8|nr:integrin alpha-PS4-like [Drosophila biarmipes]